MNHIVDIEETTKSIEKLKIELDITNTYINSCKQNKIFVSYTMEEKVSKIQEQIDIQTKQLTCNHHSTTMKESRDSHYRYEDHVCNTCKFVTESYKI